MTSPPNSSTYDVCIVGCGLMGSAIARTLATSGPRVVAWNRTLAAAEELEQWGVKAEQWGVKAEGDITAAVSSAPT